MKTPSVPWTEDATKRALFLYFQLPFGQLHKGNPEIVSLANRLGRTPSSVAMKLANFASLDPDIIASGRTGLVGATRLDRRIWEEFHKDWTGLVLELEEQGEILRPEDRVRDEALRFNYEGQSTRRSEIDRRIGQGFFRRSVLANFSNTCCVTGIADPRLLTASHISPWSIDIANRHNPRNGLCLSATLDRAFDQHLMTVTTDLKVRISRQLLSSPSEETRSFFTEIEGREVRSPTTVALDRSLLESHNANLLQ